VTHPHDQPGFSGGINAEQGAKKFRRDGEDQGVAAGRGNKPFQQIRRWQLQPFRGLNAAANGAENGPSKWMPRASARESVAWCCSAM